MTRHMLPFLAIISTVVPVISIGASVVSGQGECDYVRGVGCRIYVNPPNKTTKNVPISSGDSIGGSDAGGGTSNLNWERTMLYENAQDLTSTATMGQGYDLCADSRRDDAHPDARVNVYGWVLENNETGEALDSDIACQWPGEGPPEPSAAMMNPPTAGEVVEAHQEILRLRTRVSPDPSIGGLTGLETWLWCEDPGEISVDVELRGWNAEASMSPAEYEWRIEGANPTETFTSRTCGSEENPAAEWMPETMGGHAIYFSTTWTGAWSLSWQGASVGTFALDDVTMPDDTIGYPVDEYRGVLDDPED